MSTRTEMILFWTYGFTLLLSLTALAIIIGIGKVEQHTSYGLPIVLGALASQGGQFGQSAFLRKGESKPDIEPAQ